MKFFTELRKTIKHHLEITARVDHNYDVVSKSEDIESTFSKFNTPGWESLNTFDKRGNNNIKEKWTSRQRCFSPQVIGNQSVNFPKKETEALAPA